MLATFIIHQKFRFSDTHSCIAIIHAAISVACTADGVIRIVVPSLGTLLLILSFVDIRKACSFIKKIWNQAGSMGVLHIGRRD